MTTKTVALVIGSTRSVRLGPSVTAYVQQTMATAQSRSTPIALETIDLAEYPLPLYDEPELPAKQPTSDPTPHYAHDYTRRWSAAVSRYDGFVFVTPQYNWSVPAALKNALDHLFHEWTAKPAGIVSYGGRGGGKAAAHLADILNGLRMKVLRPAPALSTSRHMAPYVAENGAVSDEDRVRWRESGAEAQVLELARELAGELWREE